MSESLMSTTAADIIVDITPQEKESFYAQLQAFVGLEIGEPVVAPDEVNAAMIRHLVETVGDDNPIYTNTELAATSIHGGIVAPPTMLQAWVMMGFKGTKLTGESPYEKMNQLLFSRGFTSVLGVDSVHRSARY